MWQGAEQEFAAGSQPVSLFEALGRGGVFVFRSPEGIPRAYLRNGGLCYVHSNLFEVSTPECRDALQLVAYDKASEAYARLASWTLKEQTGLQVHCYKTSIAFKNEVGAEYTTLGAHENYLVERERYFERASLLMPYLVLRQVFCGVGGYYRGAYLISPRAMFPKTIYSETSSDWPIISLRDEPHADGRFFRVHVVSGEGARCEYTTFLKHSITSYVLTAIQDEHIREAPRLADPIASGRDVSKNLEGDWRVDLADGRRVKVTDYINSYYLEGIERVFAEREAKEHDRSALREFKWVLGKLGEGLIEELDRSIEWVIKLSLIERGFQE
ncbi:MAG: proteasome accessory factor PafA2 family protein, partial [Candidatus Bathyarchaeia archaeon]